MDLLGQVHKALTQSKPLKEIYVLCILFKSINYKVNQTKCEHLRLLFRKTKLQNEPNLFTSHKTAGIFK